MQMDPVRSDAIAVTSSNFGGNKIDYYLDRTVNYDVHLTPNNDATTALARRQLGVTLANTAPDSGPPRERHRPVPSRIRRRAEPLRTCRCTHRSSSSGTPSTV